MLTPADELVRVLPEAAAHPAVLSAMAQHGTIVELAGGSQVIGRGHPCRQMVLLLDGRVRVFSRSSAGREMTVYRLHPGDACVLTTCCVLRETPFPAETIVEESARALVAPAAIFRRWFADEGFWRDFVIDLLAERLEEALRLVDEVVFQRTDARLAHHLLRHVHAASGEVHATQESLAREIGTAREVVGRILERMVTLGIVSKSRGVIEVVDAERLRQMADADAPALR